MLKLVRASHSECVSYRYIQKIIMLVNFGVYVRNATWDKLPNLDDVTKKTGSIERPSSKDIKLMIRLLL